MKWMFLHSAVVLVIAIFINSVKTLFHSEAAETGQKLKLDNKNAIFTSIIKDK